MSKETKKVMLSNTIDEDIAAAFYEYHQRLVKFATRNGKLRPQKGEVLSYLMKKSLNKITIKEFYND